jgi:hypothetical protein
VARARRRPLGALFALLAAGFAGLTVWAAIAGQWIVAIGAGAVGAWLGELAVRSLR